MFYDYASALSEWLTPYHDYARPPPSVVLAEAAKMTEQKTGHPLRGLEISPEMLANGNAKKDEEPPAVVEPPVAISGYFDGGCIVKNIVQCPHQCARTVEMSKRFKEVFEGKALPHELLHVVTLTQEVSLPLLSKPRSH